jgi:hypothetical protein
MLEFNASVFGGEVPVGFGVMGVGRGQRHRRCALDARHQAHRHALHAVQGVAGDPLNVLAYNMKRVMAIIGVAALLEALAA